MDYSIGDLVTYVKTNWKHLLVGIFTGSAIQHFQIPGSAKIAAILKVLGIGG